MAAPGRPFKKGNPGGPGRPKRPKDVVTAARLTKTEAQGLLVKFMQMDITQLEAMLKDKKRKVIEHMIGRIALMGIKNGDQARLNFMLDRIIGKVKDEIEHTVRKPTIIEKLDGGVIELGAEDVKDEF